MLLFLACTSINVQAAEPEYKSDTRVLSIPSVKIDDVMFYDVKVKLNDPEVIDSSNISSSGCSSENAKKFRGIKNGWSSEQVNTEIGCEGVLQSTKVEDGVLKQRYKWSFKDTPDTASIVLFFEQDKLILQ